MKNPPNLSFRRPRGALTVAALAAFALLPGCAVLPEAVSPQARNARIEADLSALFAEVEPIRAGLSLHEAFARALKYNYDYRLKLMEEALAGAQLDTVHYDLLPRLSASAGYSHRNNLAGSSSFSIKNDGSIVESGSFSGAQERTRATQGAAFAWNVLDFGVSYVRAQQQATQTLIAEERKRKVVQNILQDVRQAYWRAYGAERVLPRLEEVLNRVNEALARSRQIEEQKLLPPQQALAYQRALLDLYQQIVQKRQELVLAKTELSALVNVRPGSEFALAPGDEEAEAARLKPLDDFAALDSAALDHRPELREEDYRKKVTVLEARKALLGLLPGLDVNLGRNYDSNKYLLNNRWSEAGASVSFNLFRAFSYPALKRQQEVQERMDDARRIALSMAVLTQVRIAAHRYHEALAEYRINRQGAEVDARLQKHVQHGTQANAESEMELLRTEVRAILSELQRYVSFANLQGAYARVANSVGADIIPDGIRIDSLGELAGQMRAADQAWRQTAFRTAAAEAPRQPVHLAATTVNAGSIDLAALVARRLEAHGAYAAGAGAGAAARADVRLGESQAGLRAVEIVWIVERDGRELGRAAYRSVVPEAVPAGWQAFAEAAAEAAAGKIGALLKPRPGKAAVTQAQAEPSAPAGAATEAGR